MTEIAGAVEPGAMRTSAGRPGRSSDNAALPATGTGSASEARPGEADTPPAHASAIRNGRGPSRIADVVIPSVTRGTGASPTIAERIVASETSGTFVAPLRKTSPSKV